MKLNFDKSNLIIWLTIILLSIIWGSSFILIKKSLIAFNPYEVGAMRILITGLSLSPALWIYRSIIEWKRWPFFLIVALTGSGIPFILYPLAETHINSSLAGVLNSTTPLFTLIFSLLLFKNKVTKHGYLGVGIGFIGALFLVFDYNQESGTETHYFYAGLILIAAMLYGMNANLVKQFFQNTKPIITTSYSFALMVPMALAYILKMNTIPNVLDHPQAILSISAVFILAIVGTSLSTIIFFGLVRRTDAVFSASVAYLIPIVAIGLGVLDGEKFGTNHIIGTILILLALKVISKKTA